MVCFQDAVAALGTGLKAQMSLLDTSRVLHHQVRPDIAFVAVLVYAALATLNGRVTVSKAMDAREPADTMVIACKDLLNFGRARMKDDALLMSAAKVLLEAKIVKNTEKPSMSLGTTQAAPAHPC